MRIDCSLVALCLCLWGVGRGANAGALQPPQQPRRLYTRAALHHRAAAKLSGAAAAAGFQLDQHAFESAFYAFDPDRNQTLNVTEFMGLSVFAQSTARIFGAFDPQRSGRITLDYNQFVYAVSNCR